MQHRRATHRGKWYSSNPSNELLKWLQDVQVVHSPARAIIAPHASYQYSGACAAYAYKQIEPSRVKRIFVMGPSHHKWYRKCALTTSEICQTPLYDLLVDRETNSDLLSTGMFEWMSIEDDEAEHSLELQFPFIAQVMYKFSDKFTIVPILVGTLTLDQANSYGDIFLKYLADPENLFIISSDFCHWGKKFNYVPLSKDVSKPIYKFIEDLDGRGISLIERLDAEAFSDYLEKYKNTICGRNPILILLYATKKLQDHNQNVNLKFLNYCQSNQCVSIDDSSVSYASASLVVD